MSEIRLIDANALQTVVHEVDTRDGTVRFEYYDVKGAPTIDAIGHARWIEIHETKEINGHILFGDGVKCSNCGEHGDGKEFCSSCGFKMDLPAPEVDEE